MDKAVFTWPNMRSRDNATWVKLDRGFGNSTFCQHQ